MSDTIIGLALKNKVLIGELRNIIATIFHAYKEKKSEIGIAKDGDSFIYTFLDSSNLYAIVKVDTKSLVLRVKFYTKQEGKQVSKASSHLSLAYAIWVIILAENTGYLKNTLFSGKNEDLENVMDSLNDNFKRCIPYSILNANTVNEATTTLCSVEEVIQGNDLFKKCFGDNFSVTEMSEGKYSKVKEKNLNNGKQIDFSSIPTKIETYKFNYSTEENVLIPCVEPWYVMPEFITTISLLIKATEKSLVPMRNFLFRGDAGTGKTEGARALAALLKRPYVTYTCSSDTEIFDFFGQAIPNKEGKIIFSETSFIKALKNGYVIEIQEPSVILKEGVLVGLNGLLDQTNTFTLPTGEVVKRHPQCIVVFTTNASYVGCNDINQSVISRCDAVYDLAEPSDKEVLKRIINLTGQTTLTTTIETMITVTKKIRRFLNEQDVTDGVCGMREIIGWVLSFVVTGNIIESARHTIVSKATGLKEYHLAILGLVKAVFSV